MYCRCKLPYNTHMLSNIMQIQLKNRHIVVIHEAFQFQSTIASCFQCILILLPFIQSMYRQRQITFLQRFNFPSPAISNVATFEMAGVFSEKINYSIVCRQLMHYSMSSKTYLLQARSSSDRICKYIHNSFLMLDRICIFSVALDSVIRQK